MIENSCVPITPSICQRPLARNLIIIPCIVHEMNFFLWFCSLNISIVVRRDKGHPFLIISLLPRCEGMQFCYIHSFCLSTLPVYTSCNPVLQPGLCPDFRALLQLEQRPAPRQRVLTVCGSSASSFPGVWTTLPWYFSPGGFASPVNTPDSQELKGLDNPVLPSKLDF